MEKKDISFLLGAGFSVDAGYPTAKQLNERLRKINKDEILIDGSGISFLLKPGEVDVNANLSNKKRKFVQEFLEFYVSNELSSEDEFDYELFYDWAIERSNKNDNLKLQAFIDDYQKGVPVEMKQSCSQLIDDFFRTYNQLIYQMLFRPVERIHYSTFPNYQIYLRFLSKLGNNHIVHIHTLNHDLFMEQLWHTDHLAGRHSDGFKELGSPYYLVNNDGYKVRTEYFADLYTEDFRLYKLHGSVDYLQFNTGDSDKTMVKSISKARIDSLLKEVVNEKGEHEYVNCWWLYHPDFLTGVDTKPKRYLEPFYYGQVFKHFEENLNKSRFLIVIGYAFRDEKVNGYIEVFLNNKNNTVVVIDPSRPNHKLLDLSNVKYIKSKTSDMEYEDLKNLVGADWQEISDDDTELARISGLLDT